MKEKITLKMPKGLFIAAMVASILVFVIDLIYDIVDLADYIAESLAFRYAWSLYIYVILDAFLCVFFICGSATILLRKSENKGGTLLLAAGIYILACGLVSALKTFMIAIDLNEFSSSYVISSILSVLQVAVGSVVIILRNRKVTAAKVISIVYFGLLAINDVKNVVLKIIAGYALPLILSFIYALSDALIIVLFCLMWKSDPEESKADKAGALE